MFMVEQGEKDFTYFEKWKCNGSLYIMMELNCVATHDKTSSRVTIELSLWKQGSKERVLFASDAERMMNLELYVLCSDWQRFLEYRSLTN